MLEGLEMIFIVIAAGAGGVGTFAALLVVVLLGAAVHRSLVAIPETTLKFVVDDAQSYYLNALDFRDWYRRSFLNGVTSVPGSICCTTIRAQAADQADDAVLQRLPQARHIFLLAGAGQRCVRHHRTDAGRRFVPACFCIRVEV